MPSTWMFNQKNRTLSYRNGTRGKPYIIKLDQCQTSAGALRWIMHAAEQPWATDRLIASLVWEFGRLLYPLANLCPDGKEDGPINVKKVIQENLDLVR